MNPATAPDKAYAFSWDSDFARFLLGRLATSFGQQMLTVAIGWEIYNRTRSALALGLVGLTDVVAIILTPADSKAVGTAIRDAKGNGAAIELITENAGYFRVTKIDYHAGEKYPHLVRDTNAHDYLDDILKPMASSPKTVAALHGRW